ncbi:MAG: ammonium transporter, partial [Methanosarcinales archaeon]|nr:ammonium transporter [Methanosarcinales archaeon]
MAIVFADTAWVLISSALVLFMLPGLALFYGGMVRRKNVLSSMMHSFVVMGIVAVLWVVVGYSLAFSEGNWFVGGLDHIFL